MQQYNYPTIIFHGEDATAALTQVINKKQLKKILLVTDPVLTKLKLHEAVINALKDCHCEFVIFDNTHPNPIEDDVDNGVKAYHDNQCDGIIALGGGSPMDVAKVIKIMVAHPAPLSQYDDAINGSEKITQPMPPLYAIATTAGTGSEVGRSGVIIMRKTGRKTIFFAPELMPDVAVLDPALTVGLPPAITAATGIDAFTHCLEAYFAPGFHPMADGIALEGMTLVLDSLTSAVNQGDDLAARANMLMAASMGATAFQKGLGMIHSLAHPLSTQFKIHHGLANALMLPQSIAFLEKSTLTTEQRARLEKVQSLFIQRNMASDSLSQSCQHYFESLGVELSLAKHGISKDNIAALSIEAIADPCHPSNMIPVGQNDLASVYEAAL